MKKKIPNNFYVVERDSLRYGLWNEGYNDREIAEITGFSIGAIKKWRCKRKLYNNYDMVGEKNPFYGKHHTEETIQYIKNFAINEWKNGMPLEVREKVSNANIGREVSEETRIKISNSQPYKGKYIQTNTGRTHFKKGIIPWNKGKKLPQYSGENHPNWNPNKPFVEKIRNYINENYEWRRKVFERDDYTCQVCGKRGCRLNAHHIYFFRFIVEDFINEYGEDLEMAKKYDWFLSIDNGITLCEECHKKVHRGEIIV